MGLAHTKNLNLTLHSSALTNATISFKVALKMTEQTREKGKKRRGKEGERREEREAREIKRARERRRRGASPSSL